MKKYLRYNRVLLYEYFTNPAIYSTVVLFALLCVLGCTVNYGENSHNLFEMIADHELYIKACKSFQYSSYALASQYDASPWFEVIVPVITAFPAIIVYENNMGRSGDHALVRISRSSYSGGLFTTAFLSGFLTAGFGILLHAALTWAFFPPLSAFPEHAEAIKAIYGSTALARLGNLLKKALNCCIVCGVFPIIAIILYRLFRDKFLALTLPMMIQYISFKFGIMFSTWIYSDTVRSSNRWLLLISGLLPSNCMRHYSLWERLKMPYACFFILTGIVLILFYVLFDSLNKKWLKDGI